MIVWSIVLRLVFEKLLYLLSWGHVLVLGVALSACSGMVQEEGEGFVQPSSGTKYSGQYDDRSYTASGHRSVNSHVFGRTEYQRARIKKLYPGSNQFYKRHQPAQEIGSSSEGERVTLNLVNVSIIQAAKTVFGDILQENYVVASGVTGKITIQTTNPIEKSSVLSVFESVLRGSSVAIISVDGLYKVVPSKSQLRNISSIATGSKARSQRQIGAHVQVVPLRFIAAAEMNRILLPIAPKGAIMRVDKARNLLLLSGDKKSLDVLIDAISVFDVDWMRGMSFALIQLRSSDPETITKELEEVFSSEKEGPTQGVIKFIPNRRINSILVITSQREYLKKAEVWINRLDIAGRSSKQQLFVYRIQNRHADELAKLLQEIFSSDEDELGSSTNLIAPRNQPITLGSSTGKNAKSGNAQKASKVRLRQSKNNLFVNGIGVIADQENNALLVTASSVQYQQVLKVLERIDVVPNQVLIEATIAEVSLNDDLKFGLRWYFQNGGSNFTLSDAATGTVGSVFPGFSYFFSAPKVQVALNALASITDVKVISSPTLMVINNKTAVLQVGDQVPITTQSAVTPTNPDAPIVNSVTLRDTGVILSVTPRVNDSGRVVLEIEQEVSDVSQTTTSGIDSPTIQQRKIKTTVAVQDGQSLALGGLVQERRSLTKQQVPIFGDIPIIGNAFKAKTDEIKRTELLIIITPHVVRNQVEARDVTDEFRRQLNLTSRPRKYFPPDWRTIVERVLR